MWSEGGGEDGGMVVRAKWSDTEDDSMRDKREMGRKRGEKRWEADRWDPWPPQRTVHMDMPRKLERWAQSVRYY